MFDFNKLKIMQELRRRVDNQENVFHEIDKQYLYAFLIDIASQTTEDMTKYWTMRNALLTLDKTTQIEICEKYYLKKESAHLCENFDTILVGDTRYEYVTKK